MATNFYINRGGTTSEKNLYEDIIIESIRFYGHDIIYLPRTLVNRDDVLGEDNISKFTNGYSLEMYFETNEGFAGEQELINKFGIELRDDTSFCVAKRTWERFVGYQNNTIVAGRPNEGDIIYFPLQKTFFEILFVEDQEPFFQLFTRL